MAVIRPSGCLVIFKSIGLYSVLAILPKAPCPPLSCAISELRCAGKRKLLFFLSIMVDVYGWFDSKGTLSESVH